MKKLKLLGVLGVSALMMIGAAATSATSADRMIDQYVGAHQGKFYSEYLTKNDLIAAGSACNLEIAREGMVLLKNKDTDAVTGKLPCYGASDSTCADHNHIIDFTHLAESLRISNMASLSKDTN